MVSEMGNVGSIRSEGISLKLDFRVQRAAFSSVLGVLSLKVHPSRAFWVRFDDGKRFHALDVVYGCATALKREEVWRNFRNCGAIWVSSCDPFSSHFELPFLKRRFFKKCIKT